MNECVEWDVKPYYTYTMLLPGTLQWHLQLQPSAEAFCLSCPVHSGHYQALPTVVWRCQLASTEQPDVVVSHLEIN